MKLVKMLTPPINASIIVFAVFAALSVRLFAASAPSSDTQKTWGAVDSVWGGLFTDVNHWDGTMPTTGQRAYLPAGKGGYTVSFPSGSYEPLCSFAAAVSGANDSLVLDGLSSSLTMPDTETDNWPNEPIRLIYGNKSLFNLVLNNARIYNKSLLKADNFKVELKTDADALPTFDVVEGTYNFWNPTGTDWKSLASNPPRLVLFAGAYDFDPETVHTVRTRLNEGVTVSCPDLNLQSATYTNILELCGATLAVSNTFYVPGPYAFKHGPEYRTEFLVTNKSAVSVSAITFGYNNGTYGLTEGNPFHLLVDDSTFDVSGAFRSRYAGVFTMDVLNGSTVTFATGSELTLGYEGQTTNYLTVADSTIDFNVTPNFGPNNVASSGGTMTRAVFTNATVNAATGFVMKGENEEVELQDGTVWTQSGDFSVGTLKISDTAKAKLVVRKGATLKTQGTKDLFVGNGGRGELLLDGGDISLSRYLKIAGATGGTGTVTVVSGSLSMPNHLYVAQSANASGKLAVEGGTVDVSGTKNIYSGSAAGAVGEIAVSGGELRGSNQFLLSPADGAKTAFNVSGGLVDSTGEFHVGQAGQADVNISGGLLAAHSYVYLGGSTTEPTSYTTNTITLTDGVLSNAFTTGNTTYLGYLGNTLGRLHVSGGRAVFNTLYGGWFGNAEILISGGYVRSGQEVRFGANTPSDATMAAGQPDVFRMTGGEFDNSKRDFQAGYSQNAKARTVKMILDGGVLKTKRLLSRGSKTAGYYGDVTFEADGGTILAVPNYSSDVFEFSGFDSAKLGAKGLTLLLGDVGTASTVAQSFSNKSDSNGRLVIDTSVAITLSGDHAEGELALSGGAFTFAAGATVSSKLVVTNGATVTIPAAIASAGTIRGLVLGDETSAATLTVASGNPIVVDGDIVIRNLNLSVSGSFEKDNAYDIFTCTGTIDERSLKVWTDTVVRSGIADDLAYDAVVTTDDQGVKHVTLNVREPRDLLIELPSGTETHTTNIQYAVADKLTTDVGPEAVLTLAGTVERGALVKTGAGSLSLTGLGSRFLAGVRFEEGALVLGAGDLTEYSSDITAAAAEPATTYLAYDVPAGKVATLSAFKGGDGIFTKTGDGELIIHEEGTLTKRTIVGSGDGKVNDAETLTIKGGKLTVDHAWLFGSSHANLCNRFTTGEHSAILEVRNGSIFNFNTINVIKNTGTGNNSNPNVSAKVIVDDSALGYNYVGEFNYQNTKCPPPEILFRNNACGVGTLHFRGNCNMWVDHSDLAKNHAPINTSTTAAALVLYVNDYTVNLTLTNGATFYCNNLQANIAQTDKPATLNLTFDDSEWNPLKDDYLFSAPTNITDGVMTKAAFNWIMSGKGMVLNPSEGQVWTVGAKISGLGGLQKRGTGTLVLPGEHQQFKGALVVEDGTVDLDGTATAGRFAGAGTIRNGSLVRATLEVDAAAGDENVLTLDGVTVSGRNKVDLGGANLPVGATLTVANYTGAAPDVSNWKLIGNGETAGTFTAAGGVITAEVTPKNGMLLIVR